MIISGICFAFIVALVQAQKEARKIDLSKVTNAAGNLAGNLANQVSNGDTSE